MKSLDSLLDTLRLKSSIQNRIVLGEPWGVEFPAKPKAAKFHYMEHGGCILNIPGHAPLRMEKGDLAIVFYDQGHSAQDLRETEPTDLFQLLKEAEIICRSGLTLRFGGDGPETSVISGDFMYEEAETHPLWRNLPPYILLKGEGGSAAEWLDTTLNLLSSEAMEVRPGAFAVLDRLCDVLFIQALRGWARGTSGFDGWAAAVQDPAIDEALDLMHRHAREPWTIESLANRVAMSRSAFAERFRRLAGDTPMEYLARWRMHLATQHLRDSQASVAVIAEQVGYESEAAFAKAFKKRVGVAPGAYRRRVVAIPQPTRPPQASLLPQSPLVPTG